MAAGLIRVKRQTVCRTVTTLLKRNTTGRTFTHQFSQLALQQSWWKHRDRERESPEILKEAVGEEFSQRSKVLSVRTAGILTAAVLVLSARTVQDAVTAQYGGQAVIIQTLVVSRWTGILRRNGARYHNGTKLFVRPVGTVELSVTPPAFGDTLKGVNTLVLVHSTGQRLGRYWAWGDISNINMNAEFYILWKLLNWF